MPVQSFRSWKASDRRKPASPQLWTTPWLKRLFVFGGGMLLTAYGAWEMYNVVSVSRTTSLQYALLVLFTVNFSWIALAFTSALLGFFGFCSAAGARRPGREPAAPHRRGDADLQ
jgi:membrane glycosyltransferase